MMEEWSPRLTTIMGKMGIGKKKKKKEKAEWLPFQKFICFYVSFHYISIQIDERHILPSKETMMTETSSWYRRRSPCRISSNSWKSKPAISQAKLIRFN
jgi:hypothetical protein